VVFHPLANSQTQQAFPVGVRLQNVSSQNPSVSNVKLISFTLQARTVKLSAEAATGLFQPSIATLGSAALVILAPPVAVVST
jgi:hypothetical protein